MQASQAPMMAAIDIGSNTIHMVVARIKPDNLDIVEDKVDMPRIGESVNATGEISSQKLDATIELLCKYKASAEQHGAEHIFVVATEAIREASNSGEFLTNVQQQTGLQVQLISGNVEAILTFYGATYEFYKEPNAAAQVGVIDLGGGSTELITAKNKQITWRTSIAIGSGWLHDRYLPSDPPTDDEVTVARTFLSTYFKGMQLKEHPQVLIFTGGSANSVLYLAQSAFGLDASGEQLTRDDLSRCLGLLTALPAKEISQRYGQPFERALILPAGALIIQELMSRLRLNDIRISPHGIREGVLLAYARFGEHWLDQVNEVAGTSQPAKNASHHEASSAVGAPDETFVQTGRYMLLERAKKLLDWTDGVLKQEDVEAVHKMRVATRRLRAALDAFEPCCNAKGFKKVYRRVKKLADLLGAARDTDVMLQNLHSQVEAEPVQDRPGSQWLMKRLEDYREDRQGMLETYLESLDEEALQQQLESLIPEGASTDGKS